MSDFKGSPQAELAEMNLILYTVTSFLEKDMKSTKLQYNSYVLDHIIADISSKLDDALI